MNIEVISYNREISETLYILYDNNEEYKHFFNILSQVHLDNNKTFKDISTDISYLIEDSQLWNQYFNNVDKLYQNKESARKTYDHYEHKLEDLINQKEQKEKKNSVNESFLKKLERVFIKI